jgi:CBS domain-containing protein
MWLAPLSSERTTRWNETMPLARDLMTTQVTEVTPSMTLRELERTLLSAQIGGAPVVQSGRLVGIVARSDIVRALAEAEDRAEEAVENYYLEPPIRSPTARSYVVQPSDLVARQLDALTVRDIMRTRIIAVPPDTPAADVASQLLRYRIHRILVTEGERLLGVISTLDLVQLLAEPAHVGAEQPPSADEVVRFTPDLTGEPSALFPGDAEITALRDDPARDAATLLARLRAGARVEAHSNLRPVQHFVLSGQYESEGQVFKAGTYRLLPSGEVPALTSSDGAVILVFYDPARA